MSRFAFVAAALICVGACKGKGKAKPKDDAAVALAPGDAAQSAWPEIAKLPNVDPIRVITVPARPTAPRFTVGGPALVGDIAVVASSQFGFAAVDFRRGDLAWTKPAGTHVAPPVILDGNVVLIGDCVNPPNVPDEDALLGCARVVTPTGSDQAYVAIHAKTDKVAAFAGATGSQRVWPDNAGHVVWRRGDQAVSVDLLSGIATPAPATDPPLVVSYKTKTWHVQRTEDGIIKAEGTSGGAPSWQTERSYGALVGAVYIPDQSPMIRATGIAGRGPTPEILLFDMDATGSMHGQVSMDPVPGIAVTAHAIDAVGNAALVVRLDKSLQHDYIAGYAANGLLIWTYPLPTVPRPDPIGVAIAHDA
ncbi:MAG: PQQ-like beta-propeller repeat protein, partial [Kofleriaceae bacterium]|nr:PQQ-like beta-propeller repeat protein [Kofleriaceae bacterium]